MAAFGCPQRSPTLGLRGIGVPIVASRDNLETPTCFVAAISRIQLRCVLNPYHDHAFYFGHSRSAVTFQALANEHADAPPRHLRLSRMFSH